MRNISTDLEMKTKYKVARRKAMTAIEIQREFLDIAEKYSSSRDSQTDEILRRWRYSLDHLLEDSDELDSQIDWRIKKKFLERYMKKKGGNLNNYGIRLLDLQFHDVDRQRGIFQLLEKRGEVEKFFSEEQIEYAAKNPPKDTRAKIRGNIAKLSKRIPGGRPHIELNWDSIKIRNSRHNIDNPYLTYEDLEETLKRQIAESI
jgi:proteasome accessory factor A